MEANPVSTTNLPSVTPGNPMEEVYRRAKEYLPIIERVYQGTNQGIAEANLLEELLKLLAVLPPDFHVFCDPIIGHISIFCLTVFSFDEQETATWLKSRLNTSLATCDKCILKFARGKCMMLQHFAIQRGVPKEHVAKFNDIVCLWRVDAVTATLRQISTNNNTAINVTKEIENAVFECLCNPQMLRLSKNLKSIFDVIFKYLFDTKYPLLDVTSDKSLDIYIPGVIYCWCEGSQEQVNWAKAFFSKLYRQKFTLDSKNITPDIIEELFFHILFLQDPSNWNDFIISQFWARLTPVFHFFDRSIFEEYFIVPKNIESLKKSFRFPIESIFILWYKHLSKPSQDKPIDCLLRALKLFLEKFGKDFWTKIEPFTFHSILDIIFDQNAFVTKLIKVQDHRIPENDEEALFSLIGSITDLLSWTLPFYHALTSSKRIQMVKKVSVAFLRMISTQPALKSIPKACLMNSSTSLLRAVLTITDEERRGLYVREDFQAVLLSKNDSRVLMNNPLTQNIVIGSATHPSQFYPDLGESASSVSTSAMMVLANCIDFDILVLCHNTFKLYRGASVNEMRLPLTLIQNLTANLDLRSFHDGPLLAKQLLISLRNIHGLLQVPGTATVIQKHNETVSNFFNLTINLIGKFTDILPNQLSEVLADRVASQGFWSCVFSSDAHIYQAATNILYDTFDVEGRLEGIQSLLNKNLANQLNAINLVLNQLVVCQFYEPCPRAVRVLMDILSAFTDPISGILSNYSTLKSEETDAQVVQFWNSSWAFLDTIYKCTLVWASKYEYSELEKFSKDTLDLSRSFVNTLREFGDVISNPSFDLFASVVKAFKNMLYWLRLSDEELLDSCVRLIISASDLAHERKIKFDDSLVEMMTRYATKARKYSNRLTENQTGEILTRARIFNDRLVDQVAEEVEMYRKEKELSKQKVSQTSTLTPTTTRPRAIESRADFLQRKATASSITGRVKVSQPKITSFGVFQPTSTVTLKTTRESKPVSKMELARRQLLDNRVVHPPSTSVFNTKPQAHIKHNDDSSDESDHEADIETARELFAAAKAKTHGIETLDITGKEIKKDPKIQLAKLEEENMRKRLNVDVNSLYKTVLQWDYTRQDEYPDEENISQYSDVKDEFSSAAEYQAVMRPLLLLECWQGLCSARDRVENVPFSIVVGNRTAVSDFYEVYTSVNKDFIQKCGITETDLIVLAYFPNYKSGDRLTSDDFRKAEHTCFAKVRSLNYTKNNNVDLTLRIHRNHTFSKFLTLRAEIHALKVMQMTTVEREYQTLESLQYYDLVSQILGARPSPPSNVSNDEIELVKARYKLNASQAEAIVHTVMQEGFSLIQGPPGTGKTKTILGIIGYFLSTRNTTSSHVIKVPTDQSSMTTEQMLRKQKVLICAPSNAAVDEICIRLKGGIYKRDGTLFEPSIVRVGRSDVVNVAIKNLTLEELVDKSLEQKHYEFNQNPELDKKFDEAVTKRRKLRDKLNSQNGDHESTLSIDDIAKLQLEIRELSKVINVLGKERDELRERNSLNYRKKDLDRRRAQLKILANSDIICSTLSGAAHDVLSSLGIKFDTVIIDEACQCTELSSIIPLRYGCKRCIMVGDPNQLPPTVLSGAASNFKYNQSLFVRMEKNSTPYLLNVQYRMHPEVSRFPSREFYKGLLKDGPGTEELNKRPWHSIQHLAPYRFFDIVSGRQEQNIKTMSYTNSEEVRIALELVDYLFKNFEDKVDFTGKLGIISPYREQMQKLRKEFTRYFGSSIGKYIDFNTIDGFQGQEKEIIIISCVRADDTKTGVGFLKDFRRMNVAFTRAKTSMWILGHRQSLYKNKLWRNLIDDATERGCLEQASAGFLIKTHQKAPINTSKKQYDNKEEKDAYDPLRRESILPQKRTANDKTTTVQPPSKRSKGDNNKTKEKNQKRKDNKKEKQPNSTPVPTAGTKKKSSIFGSTMPVESATKSKEVYINDKRKKLARMKKSEEERERHISFSDEVSIIDHTKPLKDLPASKSLSPPKKPASRKLWVKAPPTEEEKAGHEQDINNNGIQDDEDSDGYDPTIDSVKVRGTPRSLGSTESTDNPPGTITLPSGPSGGPPVSSGSASQLSNEERGKKSRDQKAKGNLSKKATKKDSFGKGSAVNDSAKESDRLRNVGNMHKARYRSGDDGVHPDGSSNFISSSSSRIHGSSMDVHPEMARSPNNGPLGHNSTTPMGHPSYHTSDTHFSNGENNSYQIPTNSRYQSDQSDKYNQQQGSYKAQIQHSGGHHNYWNHPTRDHGAQPVQQYPTAAPAPSSFPANLNHQNGYQSQGNFANFPAPPYVNASGQMVQYPEGQHSPVGPNHETGPQHPQAPTNTSHRHMGRGRNTSSMPFIPKKRRPMKHN